MKIRHLLAVLMLALPAQHASAAWTVDVYSGLGPYGNIQDAIDAMNAGAPTTSGMFDVINFSDGGDLGNFGGDSLFPGNPGDLFGVHAHGNIFVPSGFNNWYGINHDDGARLQFIGITIIDFAGPTAPRNDFGGIGNPGAGLIVAVDLWLYENYGVSSLEFFYSDASGAVGRLVPTVPEPGTLALLGLGLAGLGLSRRRKAN